MSASPKIQLPIWAQGLIAVGVLAGIATVFFIIKRNITNIKNTQDSKKEVAAADETIKTLASSGQKSSLDSLKINEIANSLFSAMNGIGTDVSAVYRAFTNVKSDLDVVNVIKAYGVRELSSGAYNPAPNFKGTLSQALTDELNPAEMKALNDGLARKGIKYRF